MVQRVKCLPAMRETWVRSLVWEDSLEKEMATHSSILVWRIPEEPGIAKTEQLHFLSFLFFLSLNSYVAMDK